MWYRPYWKNKHENEKERFRPPINAETFFLKSEEIMLNDSQLSYQEACGVRLQLSHNP